MKPETKGEGTQQEPDKEYQEWKDRMDESRFDAREQRSYDKSQHSEPLYMPKISHPDRNSFCIGEVLIKWGITPLAELVDELEDVNKYPPQQEQPAPVRDSQVVSEIGKRDYLDLHNASINLFNFYHNEGIMPPPELWNAFRDALFAPLGRIADTSRPN